MAFSPGELGFRKIGFSGNFGKLLQAVVRVAKQKSHLFRWLRLQILIFPPSAFKLLGEKRFNA
jgi:hypothetical protein